MCVEVDGTWYLQVDMTEQCFTDTWFQWLPLAIFYVILYPIGILALIILTLRYFHVRNLLTSPPVRRSYGILYIAYVADAWYFEAWDMFYKLTMTSLLHFIPDILLRLRVGAGIAYFFLTFTLMQSPYIRVNDDRMQLVVQNEILMLIILSLWTSKENGVLEPEVEIILSVLLIALFMGVFVLWILINFKAAFKYCQVKMRRKRLKQNKRLEDGLDDSQRRERALEVLLSSFFF